MAKNDHERRVQRLQELADEIQVRTGIDVREEPLGDLDELVYQTHGGAVATANEQMPDPQPPVTP